MTDTVEAVRPRGIELPADVLHLERMDRPEPRAGEVGTRPLREIVLDVAA